MFQKVPSIKRAQNGKIPCLLFYFIFKFNMSSWRSTADGSYLGNHSYLNSTKLHAWIVPILFHFVLTLCLKQSKEKAALEEHKKKRVFQPIKLKWKVLRPKNIYNVPRCLRLIMGQGPVLRGTVFSFRWNIKWRSNKKKREEVKKSQ